MASGYRTRIEPGEDIIDTRDVIKAITKLEGRLEDDYNRLLDEQGEKADSVGFEDWLRVKADMDDEDATSLLAMRELIDDVLVSGMTAREARHTLYQGCAWAALVYALMVFAMLL